MEGNTEGGSDQPHPSAPSTGPYRPHRVVAEDLQGRWHCISLMDEESELQRGK